MENLQNQNVSSTGTTPTSTNALASNTNPISTTAGSTTDNKGKQLQVLSSRKRNVDDKNKSQSWDDFTKLDGDPTTPRVECNYCGNDYACHTIINGTSNVWSHLKVCKKFPFMVDKKQNILVLEPNKVWGELGDRSVGTLKVIGYDYDECRKILVKMVIIDELPFNFVEGKGFRLFSKTLQPRFDIPSCFTVMRDCLKLYVEENERLKRALKGQRLC
jgi:hypothetical protein